jgi:hypothetical protein
MPFSDHLVVVGHARTSIILAYFVHPLLSLIHIAKMSLFDNKQTKICLDICDLAIIIMDQRSIRIANLQLT